MKIRVALGALLGAMTLAACGGSSGVGSSTSNDAPSPGVRVDELKYGPYYHNVAVQCDGTDAVYSSDGGGVYVVQDSARCGATVDKR